MAESAVTHRPDGRSATQIRPLVADFGLLHAADGSARFAQGETRVLVGVHGPRPPRGPRFENPERAVLDIKVVPASGGNGGPAEVDLEAALRSVLESVVALSAHPRTVISITVQVLNDAGSLLPCAINACVLALADASVPLYGLVAAIAVGQPAGATVGSAPCLDLLAIEEGGSPAEVLRSASAGAGGVASSSSSGRGAGGAAMAGWGVFAFGGKQLLLQESTEDEDEDDGVESAPEAAPGDAVSVCVFTRLVGSFPRGFEAVEAVEQRARSGAAAVLAFMRLALRRKVSKDALAMGLGKVN